MSDVQSDPIDTGTVPVPRSKELAYEPARYVAKAMMWRTAIVGILAAMGVALAPEFIENVDTLVQSAIVVTFGLIELFNRHKQGEDTRDKVYSPATVARIELDAQREAG